MGAPLPLVSLFRVTPQEAEIQGSEDQRGHRDQALRPASAAGPARYPRPSRAAAPWLSRRPGAPASPPAARTAPTRPPAPARQRRCRPATGCPAARAAQRFSMRGMLQARDVSVRPGRRNRGGLIPYWPHERQEGRAGRPRAGGGWPRLRPGPLGPRCHRGRACAGRAGQLFTRAVNGADRGRCLARWSPACSSTGALTRGGLEQPGSTSAPAVSAYRPERDLCRATSRSAAGVGGKNGSELPLATARGTPCWLTVTTCATPGLP